MSIFVNSRGYINNNPKLLHNAVNPSDTAVTLTTPLTLTAAQMTGNADNNGLGAAIWTLPAPSACAGQSVRFCVETAATIQLIAPAVVIALNGTLYTTITMGGVVGTSVDVWSDGVYYYVTDVIGGLTILA